MLAFELNNRDFRRIWLFYVVRDEQEAVYDSEIRESYLEAELYIDYTLWLTGSRGRITAAQVAAEIAPLEGYAGCCAAGSGSFPTDSSFTRYAEFGVKIEDDGQPFNPLEALEPDITKPLEERKIGGLGIHLVRKLMDRLEYKRPKREKSTDH